MQSLRTSSKGSEAWAAGVLRGKLLRWTYLEPTPNLERTSAIARRRYQDFTGDAQARHILRQRAEIAAETLADGLERDAAREARPDGCWCFGMGGKNPSAPAIGANLKFSPQGDLVAEHPIASDDAETVYLTTCPYCPEGQAEEARKAELFDALRHQRPALPRSAWAQSGVPSGFQGYRLETSPVGEYNPGALIMLAGLPTGSFVFHGPSGTGKTGLAVGFAWAWQQRHHREVRFVTLPALLTELRASYQNREGELSEKELIARYAEAPLLILDEMGAEQLTGSGWVEDKLYQIIGERHGNDRPTIFTSNMDMAETVQRLGQRIAFRIIEMCGQEEHIIHIDGPNLRDK